MKNLTTLLQEVKSDFNDAVNEAREFNGPFNKNVIQALINKFDVDLKFKGKDGKIYGVSATTKVSLSSNNMMVIDNSQGEGYEGVLKYRDIKSAMVESINEAQVQDLDFRSLLGMGERTRIGESEYNLMQLSDAFEAVGHEQADEVASHLNMAIELKQDGLTRAAAPHMIKFNKACKEALKDPYTEGIYEARLTKRNVDKVQKAITKTIKSVDSVVIDKKKSILFVNYTKFSDKAKVRKSVEKLGYTYDNDGRSTNAPRGIIGVGGTNWMSFIKESVNENFQVDQIAQKKFKKDFAQLSPSEKDWVSDEVRNRKESVTEVESEDGTEFNISLKHLLKKHVTKGGEVSERFKHDDMYAMLDIAAQYSSTQHQAANQMWSDEQDLYDYLKSDHIPKKYHKDFYNDVRRRFKDVSESVKKGKLLTEMNEVEILKHLMKARAIAAGEKKSGLVGGLQKHISQIQRNLRKTAESLSMINKGRAKAAIKQIKAGKRDDGMGKFTSKLFGLDKNDYPHEITDERDINKYVKFGLGEAMKKEIAESGDPKKYKQWWDMGPETKIRKTFGREYNKALENRVKLLLSLVDDPDKAEKYAEMDFQLLPDDISTQLVNMDPKELNAILDEATSSPAGDVVKGVAGLQSDSHGLSASDIKKATDTIKKYVKKLGKRANGDVEYVASNIADILRWNDTKQTQLADYLLDLNSGSDEIIFESFKTRRALNEAEDPMSSLLQTFEKAMTDKATMAKIVAELDGAPDNVKPKLMMMADKFIPEKVDGIEDLIAELESGVLDPEDIGANETKEVLIKQFKEFIKVTDFAIATIKKHVSGGGLKESRLIKLASLLPRG